MTTIQNAVFVWIFLFNIFSRIQAAPAGSNHPIVSRDTDEDISLKSKLGRIRELIAQLDSEGEKSDQSNAADTVPPHTEKVEAQEKQMRSLGQGDRERFRATAEALKKNHAHKFLAQPKPASPAEDSIEVLAQALARLRLSQAEEAGSFGERMGTGYNQQRKPEKPAEAPYDKTEMSRQLEQTIAEALARLQQEDEPPSKLQKLQPPSYKNFHEEAIRMVETLLLRDIELADRLGLSIEDLIQDFEEQESREDNLQKLESSLASLIGDRDE